MQGTTMKHATVIGIDLAKIVFHLQGDDATGKRLFRKKLKATQVLAFLATHPPCLVAMEACASAHYWAREIKALGHDVRLIAPQHVKPYVKGNKNDWADAEAIAEAASRPKTRFVAVKSQEHLDVQHLHRVRERLVHNRTQLANQMRGFLLESGIAIAKTPRALKAFVDGLLAGEGAAGVSERLKETVAALRTELTELDAKVKAIDERIERFARGNDECRRLRTIPGLGPISATALWAATPDPRAFKNGRQHAAVLGLTPKHRGTGGENTILGISKRGDRYVRSLLVHGARAALVTADKRSDRVSAWAGRLKEKKGWNKAAVALANKNARIAWSILRWGTSFEPHHQATQPAA
jgi:transposase